MKLPRDLAAADLIKALATFGYRQTRRKGSHIRLTTQQQGEHHVTVPDHDPLRIGTLSGIVARRGRPFRDRPGGSCQATLRKQFMTLPAVIDNQQQRLADVLNELLALAFVRQRRKRRLSRCIP
jgi:predicted RNA binding protein YcfA (HicA-like mRNA interferase family)